MVSSPIRDRAPIRSAITCLGRMTRTKVGRNGAARAERLLGGAPKKRAPARAGARREPPTETALQTVEDLIGPEPLETMQRLVQRGELVGIDAADLFHRTHVLLVA